MKNLPLIFNLFIMLFISFMSFTAFQQNVSFFGFMFFILAAFCFDGILINLNKKGEPIWFLFSFLAASISLFNAINYFSEKSNIIPIYFISFFLFVLAFIIFSINYKNIRIIFPYFKNFFLKYFPYV
jgi:hypothetical protein